MVEMRRPEVERFCAVYGRARAVAQANWPDRRARGWIAENFEDDRVLVIEEIAPDSWLPGWWWGYQGHEL